MWRLYLTAKATAQRPSDLLSVADRWAALQFDNAVVMLGTAIENAAHEQENVGGEDKPRWRPKYTLEQLLDDEFRLPVNEDNGDAAIEELIGMSGEFFDEVRA